MSRRRTRCERKEGVDTSRGTCFNPVLGSERDRGGFPLRVVEVCLRCGLDTEGTLEEVIDVMHAHVCDPKELRRRGLPRWALVGRRRK